MRRAVIVVNGILLIGRTMAVLGMHQIANFMMSFSQGFVDSDMKEVKVMTSLKRQLLELWTIVLLLR